MVTRKFSRIMCDYNRGHWIIVYHRIYYQLCNLNPQLEVFDLKCLQLFTTDPVVSSESLFVLYSLAFLFQLWITWLDDQYLKRSSNRTQAVNLGDGKDRCIHDFNHLNIAAATSTSYNPMEMVHTYLLLIVGQLIEWYVKPKPSDYRRLAFIMIPCLNIQL